MSIRCCWWVFIGVCILPEQYRMFHINIIASASQQIKTTPSVPWVKGNILSVLIECGRNFSGGLKILCLPLLYANRFSHKTNKQTQNICRNDAASSVPAWRRRCGETCHAASFQTKCTKECVAANSK